jgi:hypothetical protein
VLSVPVLCTAGEPLCQVTWSSVPFTVMVPALPMCTVSSVPLTVTAEQVPVRVIVASLPLIVTAWPSHVYVARVSVAVIVPGATPPVAPCVARSSPWSSPWSCRLVDDSGGEDVV